MSMKIKISVIVEKRETGLHVMTCPKHQNMLMDDLANILDTLTEDATAELGVEQEGSISCDDLEYDEARLGTPRRSPASSLLDSIAQSVAEAGGSVVVLSTKDRSDNDSTIADAPNEAFLHPRSA